MVKTTINLDTDVYRELVSEVVVKYGTTKNLSKLINEKLKAAKGRSIIDIVKKTSGIWKIKESGIKYTRRLRAESERRIG